MAVEAFDEDDEVIRRKGSTVATWWSTAGKCADVKTILEAKQQRYGNVNDMKNEKVDKSQGPLLFSEAKMRLEKKEVEDGEDRGPL